MKPTLITIKNKHRGFTLIELIVSLGLFAVVMTISAGAVLAILDANAKAQSASAIMTNLNIALDGMTREMRTGTDFDCDGGTATFSFTTQEGVDVIYARDATTIPSYPSITKKVGSQAAVAITAPEIAIDTLQFSCSGTAAGSTGDMNQPLVRIVIRGQAGVKQSLISHFDIQTSVTQRLLDI